MLLAGAGSIVVPAISSARWVGLSGCEFTIASVISFSGGLAIPL